MTGKPPEERQERPPGARTGVGFLLAVFLGVLAGMFSEPALGTWSVIIGVAVAMVADRVIRWNAAWARHAPDEPHEHLGPVSVDEGLRGQGLGSALLLEHVRRLDAIGAVGYLETDRPEAVPFYRRFGYFVVARQTVLGVPCWFLRRPSAA